MFSDYRLKYYPSSSKFNLEEALMKTDNVDFKKTEKKTIIYCKITHI